MLFQIVSSYTVMVHQEEGWPLGLQPLNNVRVVGGHGSRTAADVSFGSTSFSSFISASPTSLSDSSSDYETEESTGSFFQDRSVTLGRLIGVDIPTGCSSHRRRKKHETTRSKKSHEKAGSKTYWFFSLCLKAAASSDACRNSKTAAALSLRDFLKIERGTNSVL